MTINLYVERKDGIETHEPYKAKFVPNVGDYIRLYGEELKVTKRIVRGRTSSVEVIAVPE